MAQGSPDKVTVDKCAKFGSTERVEPVCCLLFPCDSTVRALVCSTYYLPRPPSALLSGPGKAERGSEGGNGGAAPHGFIGQKIPLKRPRMATAVIFEIGLERSTRHHEQKWASLGGCFWFVKYLGRAKRREGQKGAVWSPHHPVFSRLEISLKASKSGNGW